MGKVSASGAGSFATSGVSRTIVKPGTARASLSRNRILSSKRAIRLLRARQQAIAGPVVLVNNFGGEEYDWKGCRMMEASAEQPGGDKMEKVSAQLPACIRVERYSKGKRCCTTRWTDSRVDRTDPCHITWIYVSGHQ